MLTNPHYEAVRAKVIAACPDYAKEEKVFKEFLFALNSLPCDAEEAFGEIPDGPKIRLSHVLRTILNQGRYFKLLPIMGEKTVVGIDSDDRQQSYKWSIEKDDLASQSPETWEALDKMLSV